MKEKKAKIVLFFLAFTSVFGPLYSSLQIPQGELLERIDIEPYEDEVVMLERMTKISYEQWQAQCKLKTLIKEYKKDRELFLKGDQSKIHATYMIQNARLAKEIIYQNHLEHLFSLDFLQELALLGQIGKDITTLPCALLESSIENQATK